MLAWESLSLLDYEEINYPVLRELLKDYANPDEAIASLVSRGDLIRVCRGWYVRGERLRKRPVSGRYLANMIYSPSFISLEFALAHHGLIPERAHTVTSVASRPSRTIDTPLGRFSYRHVSDEFFVGGMDRCAPESGPPFFVATPERALSDTILAAKGWTPRNTVDCEQWLFDNLRIDPEDFRRLRHDELRAFAERFGSRKIGRIAELLASMSAAPARNDARNNARNNARNERRERT